MRARALLAAAAALLLVAAAAGASTRRIRQASECKPNAKPYRAPKVVKSPAPGASASRAGPVYFSWAAPKARAGRGCIVTLQYQVVEKVAGTRAAPAPGEWEELDAAAPEPIEVANGGGARRKYVLFMRYIGDSEALASRTVSRTVRLKPDPAPAVTQLRIAHVNDVHNRIEQTSSGGSVCQADGLAAGTCLGGWPRLATAVNVARQEAAAAGAGFLFLDAGDQFDGSLWDVVYQGEVTAAIQNVVKPDAMTLGNHEFTFPPSVLASYVRNLSSTGTPMLGACNIDASGVPAVDGLLKKFVVKKFGPYKVGLVGWITPDTAFAATNAGGFKFGAVAASVKACLAELRQAHKDVHLIIGLSHTGYEDDIALAKEVPDFDLIIGGHTHTFLSTPANEGGPIWDTSQGATPADCVDKFVCDQPKGPYPTYVTATSCAGAKCVTPVVQVQTASKYLGHVTFDLATKALTASRVELLGGPAAVTPVTPDAAVTAIADKFRGPVDELSQKPAGFLTVTLEAGSLGRTKETNFGSWTADLVVEEVARLPAFVAQYGLPTIGLINSGMLRANIDPPTVSYGTIISAIPFLNTVAVKSLTGAELLDALAFGVSGVTTTKGRYLQVAGLRYWHNSETFLGAKLLNTSSGATAPIVNGTAYPVVMPDFVAAGGDGFAPFINLPTLYINGAPIDELVFKAFTAAAPQAVTVPDPTQLRRIINCAAAYVDCANNELYGPCCNAAAAAAAQRAEAAAAAAAVGVSATP